jgi:hypothetical protein
MKALFEKGDGMKKSELKAAFIKAKAVVAKYIGVSIQTEGNSEPEYIINSRANFNAKFDYYMEAYDDELVLIAAKGNKDIRITSAAHGNSFEDIQWQITEKGKGWRKLLSDAIDRAYEKMIAATPPQDDEEKIQCEGIKEAVKGMFISGSRSAAEARFIEENVDEYEKIFDVCMNGNDLEFKKGLVDLQRKQNEFMMRGEGDE